MRARAPVAARLLEIAWRDESNEYAPGLRLLAPELRGALARVMVATAVGLCGRDLDSANVQVERLIAVQVDSASRREWRSTFLARTWSRQSPCTGGRSAQRIGVTPELLPRMQAALARHDTAEIRVMWSQIKKVRVGAAPDSYSVDATYQEAWVLAACGLAAEAGEQLDLVLASMPLASTRLTLEVDQATALVRALRLRADLYKRQGRSVDAERYVRLARELAGPEPGARDEVGVTAPAS
ncbi:MAG: hypothetical protein ABI910_20375 [Gemmatimonadota bacterium]